ncbi:hypothetical protein CEXT_355481 [Caerostris extrusa]|uniref:Uncharacterized protein n=1 Tax=Caerostris extrusa TaxID=172846 RepID=A0AAV4RPF5_CAEEX|nr:hypothetical protein CEXT_355481 [Caerostris extrusa]
MAGTPECGFLKYFVFTSGVVDGIGSAGVEHDGTGSAFQCRRDVDFMDSVYRSAVHEQEWSECSSQQFSPILKARKELSHWEVKVI